MDNLFDYFMSFISVITPLAVGYLSYRSSKQEKKSKEYMELMEKNKTLEKKESEREKRETLNQIKALTESVESLKTEVEDLKKEIDLKTLSMQLNKLQHLNEFNFEFIQSLSTVVTTLSEESMEAENIDGSRLRSVVNEHKKTETKIMQDIYKIMY